MLLCKVGSCDGCHSTDYRAALILGPKAKNMNKYLPGLGLTIGIAALGFALDALIPVFNAVLWALLLGVLLGNVREPATSLRAGIDLGGKEILNLSVIFLGFDISARQIGALGWSTLAALVIAVALVLTLAFVLARVLRCPTSTGWLVGFGTAICGSSAIAALSGSVSMRKEDTGIALAVVNLLGLAGMLLLPAVLPWLGQPAQWSGALIGGTLHAVGNVAGAGYAISDEVGQLALTVKLGRVALLAPALVFYNWLINRESAGFNAFKLPYYLWGFMAIVALTSLAPMPEPVVGAGKLIGKALLTLAMAAIGLKISLSTLFRTGRVALGFGVLLFLAQVGVFVGVLWVASLKW